MKARSGAAWGTRSGEVSCLTMKTERWPHVFDDHCLQSPFVFWQKRRLSALTRQEARVYCKL